MGPLTHFIFWVMGNRDETGAWYGFWSGFAGGVRVFEWPVLAGLVWWHHNCAEQGCRRWGRHLEVDTGLKKCRRHHSALASQ